MDLVKYLIISLIIFLIGTFGIVLNNGNLIIMLISIELMLLASNFNFITFSIYLDDIMGQVDSLLILTVAAGESAIGLAILIIFYRVRGTIGIEFINMLKG